MGQQFGERECALWPVVLAEQIQPLDGGKDAFVHISAVEKAGMATLQTDQRVSFELEQDQRGKTSAVNLQDA